MAGFRAPGVCPARTVPRSSARSSCCARSPGQSSARVLKRPAELSFGTAELTLNMGFVASRVRLLRLIHRVAEAGLVPDVLTALPAPPLLSRSRDRLLVRLAEPVTAAGMAMFEMSWETGGLDSRPRTVADLRLTLRAGGAGQTFIGLAGTVWHPGDTGTARRAVMACAEEWLSWLAEVLNRARTVG
jgi:hypothetical protein